MTRSDEGPFTHEEEYWLAWSQILERSSKTSSLKFALARALLDVSHRRAASAEPVSVPLDELSGLMVDYYWTQVVLFRLKQAAAEIHTPKIVHLLHSASAVAPGIRSFGRLPAEARKELLREMSRGGFREVRPRFHRVPGASQTRVQFFETSTNSLLLPPRSLRFLRSFRKPLLAQVLFHWTRWLEKFNNAPRIAGKLAFNGASAQRQSHLGLTTTTSRHPTARSA